MPTTTKIMDSHDNKQEDSAGFTFQNRDVSLEMIRETIQKSNEQNEVNVRNLTIELVSNVGQVNEHFRGKSDQQSPVGLTNWSTEQKKRLSDSLSDTLISLVQLSESCGIDLAKSAVHKMEKNKAKYPVSKAYGVAKKYDQL